MYVHVQTQTSDIWWQSQKDHWGRTQMSQPKKTERTAAKNFTSIGIHWIHSPTRVLAALALWVTISGFFTIPGWLPGFNLLFSIFIPALCTKCVTGSGETPAQSHFSKGWLGQLRSLVKLNMDHVKPGSIKPHFIQRASNFVSNLSHFWKPPTQSMIRVRQSRVDIKWQAQCHKPSHYSNHLRFIKHWHHPCFYIGVYPQAWMKLTDSLSSLWLSHPWKIWYSVAIGGKHHSHYAETSQHI